MKIGLGLYSPRNDAPDQRLGTLSDENFRYAAQLGVTHIVAHLSSDRGLDAQGSGRWEYAALRDLRNRVERFGLSLAAIENFPPYFWDQVLLDGPGRDAQMANLKATITNMGKAGIPVMGYYFSLAGVWGRVQGPFARAGAVSVGYLEDQAPPQTPIPHGEVWNCRYRDDAGPGDIGTVSREQMWDRLERFLRELVPVAEQARVRLAAHPDDPPIAELRGTGRLITHPDHYQRLLDAAPSHYNGIEFCQGTITEMQGSDVYQAIRRYASGGHICYVHFRNVQGKVPNYKEVFLDEGDTDIVEALRAYRASGFDGVIIPDHTPGVCCDAPWHAGMAFAIGYLRALLKVLE